ncbi:MAG: hypothetical protein IT262_06670 [Saprospiraceae bacterium]|nr:hypothetical protein [Saprospiraceae bacterium]
MSDSILDFRDPRGLANDIQFCEALNFLESSRQKIFFDTAGVVDMLLGWESLLDVDARYIKWPFFNRQPMLICALAYKKWLGPIHLLPPHTEELTNKMLNDKRRFPDVPLENTEMLTTEFWAANELQVKETGLDKDEYISALQKDATSIFKGMFLGSHNGFWKSRYKYLVKDAQTLHLAGSTDYDYGNITSHRLFRPLLRFLNDQRKKQANNYLDAIALCLLDEKLRQFDISNTSTTLPIFFSNQEPILKAVRHFSQERDQDGRYPFTYLSPAGKPFLIVRNCNFFIISGIYQGIRESALPDLMEKYSSYLSSLRLKFDDNIQGENNGAEETVADYLSLLSYVQPSSEENVLLSFFQEWLRMEGYQDLNTILSGQLGRREVVKKEVERFIEAEQARQRQQLKGFGDRISIVRGIWHDFTDSSTFIEKNYSQTVDLDVYKEIGPRLYYSEAVCKRVQDYINRIFLAAHNSKDGERDLIDTFTDVVNDLASSLFSGQQKPIDAEKLERLACGLAVLWIFEKYKRIGQICDTVYERYNDVDPSDEADKYPAPSIALIHAAAILAGRLPQQDHALRIIECVMRKFGAQNYNVWLGLSYIHTSIWRFSGGGFNCPEWHYYRTRDLNFEPPSKQNLEESLRLSRKTYEWLRDDEKSGNITREKMRERQAKQFYALNNYLFMLAICGSAEEFRESLYLAEGFQDGVSIRDAWHKGRYADTLACYYLRMSMLSETQGEFDRNIKRALSQSNTSIADSNRQVDAYEQLNMKINEVAEKGFDFIHAKMLQYEQKMRLENAVVHVPT